jgi:hypothetical protein
METRNHPVQSAYRERNEILFWTKWVQRTKRDTILNKVRTENETRYYSEQSAYRERNEILFWTKWVQRTKRDTILYKVRTQNETRYHSVQSAYTERNEKPSCIKCVQRTKRDTILNKMGTEIRFYTNNLRRYHFVQSEYRHGRWRDAVPYRAQATERLASGRQPHFVLHNTMYIHTDLFDAMQRSVAWVNVAVHQIRILRLWPG